MQVVKNKIIVAFHSAYKLLAQSQDGRLTPCDNQLPTGEQLIEKGMKHRGNIYLAEEKVHMKCVCVVYPFKFACHCAGSS